MYIIKQKNNLTVRFVEDCEDNWTYSQTRAKVWASKALADAYIKFRGYKKCIIQELSEEDKAHLKKFRQTKCWECKNATKCSWAKGNPVENWNAIPTKIKEATINGVPILVDSYLVLDCPEFDKIHFETKAQMLKRLAKEQGITTETIRNRLEKLKELTK